MKHCPRPRALTVCNIHSTAMSHFVQQTRSMLMQSYLQLILDNKKMQFLITYNNKIMATVVIYNNDITGALRALKKEQQKEGTFRCIKAKKTFKNNREKALERMMEIIRRKIKDRNEKALDSSSGVITSQGQKPFVFQVFNHIVKIYNNGKVCVYTTKNKKVNELMLDKADFDDASILLAATKIAEKVNSAEESSTEDTQTEETEEND